MSETGGRGLELVLGYSSMRFRLQQANVKKRTEALSVPSVLFLRSHSVRQLLESYTRLL